MSIHDNCCITTSRLHGVEKKTIRNFFITSLIRTLSFLLLSCLCMTSFSQIGFEDAVITHCDARDYAYTGACEGFTLVSVSPMNQGRED